MTQKRFFIFSVLLLCWHLGFAEGLQITPVRLKFDENHKISSFKVTNLTDKAILLQSQAYRWTQKDGNNVYKASDKLFIAPPIATVPAGKAQLFRVAMKDLSQTDKEQTFRIYIQEVLPKKENQPGNLKFALRIGLPVFVKATKVQPIELEWRVVKSKQGRLKIVLKNLSGKHIQVTRLSIMDKTTNKALTSQKTFTYILPQQSHDFEIKAPKSILQKRQTLHLQAVTDSGKIDRQVNLSS